MQKEQRSLDIRDVTASVLPAMVTSVPAAGIKRLTVPILVLLIVKDAAECELEEDPARNIQSR